MKSKFILWHLCALFVGVACFMVPTLSIGQSSPGGKPARMTTIAIPKDDAPEPVKAYYKRCQAYAAEKAKAAQKEMAYFQEGLNQVKEGKIDPKVKTNTFINGSWRFHDQNQKNAEIASMEKGVTYHTEQFEVWSRPGIRVVLPLLEDKVTEPRVGMIGKIRDVVPSEVISAEEAIVTIVYPPWVVDPSDYEWYPNQRPANYEKWVESKPVYLKGFQMPPSQINRRVSVNQVVQVTSIIQKDGKSYPMVEHFVMYSYLQEISMEQYNASEYAAGAATQPALTTQPSTRPAAGASTRPTTRRAGAR